jgi:hypothetical protein
MRESGRREERKFMALRDGSFRANQSPRQATNLKSLEWEEHEVERPFFIYL